MSPARCRRSPTARERSWSCRRAVVPVHDADTVTGPAVASACVTRDLRGDLAEVDPLGGAGRAGGTLRAPGAGRALRAGGAGITLGALGAEGDGGLTARALAAGREPERTSGRHARLRGRGVLVTAAATPPTRVTANAPANTIGTRRPMRTTPPTSCFDMDFCPQGDDQGQSTHAAVPARLSRYYIGMGTCRVVPGERLRRWPDRATPDRLRWPCAANPLTWPPGRRRRR